MCEYVIVNTTRGNVWPLQSNAWSANRGPPAKQISRLLAEHVFAFATSSQELLVQALGLSSLLMALKYSTSLSNPSRSSSSYCSFYSSSVSFLLSFSSSSTSAYGDVFFSLCFVLILFVLTSLRCSCHYSSSSSSASLLEMILLIITVDVIYIASENQSFILCGGSYAL